MACDVFPQQPDGRFQLGGTDDCFAWGQLGVILTHLMIDSCTVVVQSGPRAGQRVPAFRHGILLAPGGLSGSLWKRYGMVFCDQEVLKQIEDNDLVCPAHQHLPATLLRPLSGLGFFVKHAH